jgi:hypothetical protein
MDMIIINEDEYRCSINIKDVRLPRISEILPPHICLGGSKTILNSTFFVS